MTPTTAKTVPVPEVLVGTYFSYGLFACFAASYVHGGFWWSLPALFVMLVVPVLDSIFGEDLSRRLHLDANSVSALLLRFAPHGFIIAYAVAIGFLSHAAKYFSPLEASLAALSTGMIGSIGITAAHELVHKSSSIDKALGRLGLANVMYLHFEINHVRGHHVHAGTPHDESTAFKGESLYAFMARTVPRCVLLSWHLESKRLKRRSVPPWSIQNLMLKFLIIQIVYLFGVLGLGGWHAIGLFIIQSAVAVFMLESVAYIEHYGLVRKALPNNRFGNMNPSHSWDSYYRFSNYLTFHLQRHADHHTSPAKSFAELQPEPLRALRLPAGYPVMISAALCPPLWRWVMDRRIPAP